VLGWDDPNLHQRILVFLGFSSMFVGG